MSLGAALFALQVRMISFVKGLTKIPLEWYTEHKSVISCGATAGAIGKNSAGQTRLQVGRRKCGGNPPGGRQDRVMKEIRKVMTACVLLCRCFYVILYAKSGA